MFQRADPIVRPSITTVRLLVRAFRKNAAALLLLGVLGAPGSAPAQGAATLLDVNDVSFLWPAPKTKADADGLISLADQGSDGLLVPTAVFKALMLKAETISVNSTALKFPDARFNDPHTWKVAGIRFNPSALGTNPKALAVAEVPGVRLIVQPVLVDGNDAHPQDFTAHVVFNFVLPLQPGQPVKADRVAFGRIVQDLRELKRTLNLPIGGDLAKLQVHPAFLPDPKMLTDHLRELLKKRLSSKQMDRNQVAAISFMGLPSRFEPWIFFKVEVDTATNTLTQKVVSGRFDPAQPTSQMFSFRDSPTGKVVPAPLPPAQVTEVSTAALFPPPAAAQLEAPLLQNVSDPAMAHFKVRDSADLVANPRITSTVTTDCVSCHTESTRRHLVSGLVAQPGTAFVRPAGISDVSPGVLPRDIWNVRNFGWGFNFRGAPDAPQGFQPTVSQRAANEAAESADFINTTYPDAPLPAERTPP